MTFIPEDGTGVTNANAYASVVDIDAIIVDRGGDTVWTAAATGVKEAAIVRATDYIEARFGSRFLGTKLTTTQSLGFPRQCLYDRNGQLVEGIPTPFKIALSEYVKRALDHDLWNEPLLNPKGRVVTEREKVGPIESDIRYAFNRDVSQIKPVPGADRLIQQYCAPSGSVMR